MLRRAIAPLGLSLLLAPAALAARYPVPGDAQPMVTAGPDGSVWVTARNPSRIGQIPAHGPLVLRAWGAGRSALRVAADGTRWWLQATPSETRVVHAGHTVGTVPRARGALRDLALDRAEEPWALLVPHRGPPALATFGAAGRLRTVALPTGARRGTLIRSRDGTLWCTYVDGRDTGVARLTPAGRLRLTLLPASGTSADGPAHAGPGAGGAVWVSERAGDRLTRIDADGTVHRRTPHGLHGEPLALTTDAHGTLWFTQFGVPYLGELEPDGHLRQPRTPGHEWDGRGDPPLRSSIATTPSGEVFYSEPNAITRT